MDEKKVIVFLQVYNGEKYLRPCIESVIEQSYTNFEFHIIDNNSIDTSKSIIEEYSNIDDRIMPFFSMIMSHLGGLIW